MEDVARPHFFSTVYGAAASSASSFVHHTQQISMDGGGRWRATPETHQQAGAQDAYQLAHSPERANWVTNKQTAHGLLRSRPPGEGAHAA